MLVRTALYLLLVQALATVAIASAVPSGAAWLTVAGFVTPYYDSNVFALKLAPVPWTDPVVYVSVQTLMQMAALAAAGAALITLVRVTPWQHGVLPDSTPPAKDKGSGQGKAGSPAAAPATPAAAAPASPPAAPGPAPKPPS